MIALDFFQCGVLALILANLIKQPVGTKVFWAWTGAIFVVTSAGAAVWEFMR